MPTTKAKKTTKSRAKPKLLNVAFVLDMSGSMGFITEATREAAAKYLRDLQAEERKLVRKHGRDIYTRLSLTAFDTIFERWIIDLPIDAIDVAAVTGRYLPRGGTALFDAIANTVTQLSERDDGKSKFLVVVLTDGLENSSQEYSLKAGGRERLNDLITSLEAKGNWTFVYLGTSKEAFAEAASVGVAAGNYAYFDATPDSVPIATAGVSNVTNTLRKSKLMNTNSSFSDAGETNDYRDISATNVKEPKSKLWTPDGS